MADIVWTKEWSASDDGTIVTGADLGNIQDDIGSGITTDATTIQGVPIDAPIAGDDGKLIYYDHGNTKFDYAPLSSFITETIIQSIIPPGVILMWSGTINVGNPATDIPTGWYLCDGNNGTPDLTDKFVIHADDDSGGTRDVGDTGGAHEYDLSHDHTVSHDNWGTQDAGAAGGRLCTNTLPSGAPNDCATGSKTTSSGGSATQATIPKFYALAFIMKA